MDVYDTLIVGGGAAGCVLAARLSETGRRRVGLIEAGPDTPPDAVPSDIRDPYPLAYSNPAYFWPGLTAKARPDAIEIPYPQARVMGGGSSVMGMWALRGLPSDYDDWSKAGATGWAWSDVLPSFNRLESDADYPGPLHGSNGPIPIMRHPVERWPGFARALLAAAERRGLRYRQDLNADFADGVFPVPLTKGADGRVSAATGYLTASVRHRPNLSVFPRATVRRVLIEARRVVGVEVHRNEGVEQLRAREVILSAGAIHSPAILLRSGIGPAAALKRLGIEPHLDLAGVGRGLQNHCVINLAMPLARSARQPPSLRTYGLACARVSSGLPGFVTGDLHLQFVAKTGPFAHGDRLGILGAALYRPLSRGSVEITSPDPDVSPRVDFRLLSHPADEARLAQSVAMCVDLLDSPDVRRIRGDVFTIVAGSLVRRLNRPGTLNRLASAALAAMLDMPDPIRRQVLRRVGHLLPEDRSASELSGSHLFDYVTPVFHPTGTCAMGRQDDPQAVLDPDCRVRGIDGLRVVDASIMPSIPAGNTCLPAMMIAEHAVKRIANPTQAGAE